ncbi:MAG: DUF5681 domain-containing protein [Rhizomicrobium sp.]
MGKVGYKRPPTHAQFAKGKSGNPKGRPKGASNANSFDNVMNTSVTVNVNGVARKMTLDEALLMGLAQRGLAGNTPAAREYLKIADKVKEKAEQKQIEEERPPLGSCPPIARFVLGGPDFDDCSDALFKLGAMHADGKNWRLETWVIEASFALLLNRRAENPLNHNTIRH